MEPFSVLPLRLFLPPGDDAIPSFPATPLPQMALATCRRRQHVAGERCSDDARSEAHPARATRMRGSFA